MRYKLKCKTCPATCWVRGTYESDTNALELSDQDEYEWEPEASSACKHEDYDIVDEESDDSDD